MGIIYKFKTRIKERGLKYVLWIILKNKIYRPINAVQIKIVSFIFKHAKLRNMIIMESHNDFDTNGGAFYNYLIEHGYNKKYRIIWLIKNKKPDILPYNVECFSIFKPSMRKAFYICTAKYFTADDIVTDKVRRDQKSFYLSHGAVGYKKCNCSIPDSVDYVLMPSEEFAPYCVINYHIPYPSKRLVYLGYPVQDYLYHQSFHETEKITASDTFVKRIIWMPTFRKGGGSWRNDSSAEQSLGIPLIGSLDDYHALNKFLKERRTLLIIKLHPMQVLDNLGISSVSNIKVLTKDSMKKLQLDNYRLLVDADALISDYSSIAVEYLHLNRPLAFVLEDLKQYVGFTSEQTKELLVGNEIYSLNDMKEFIVQVVENRDPNRARRQELFDRVYKYHDGKSSERLAAFMEL